MTGARMETTEALMNDVGQGKIVTFYSYKGGTGRTMALANVAWVLASNGKRVLAVDWDLESPGLHKFFHPFLDQSVVDDTPGVIEIINDYATAAVTPGERPDDWHVEYARVLPHAVSLNWEEFPGEGTLDFLSAGRQNRDYSAAICSLDWDNFYDRLGGGRFFRAMREDMKNNYDYVLIDSRTGLSDVADICTVELPDVLVTCFTLNNQGIDGAASVAQQINRRYRNRNIRILPIPMRIEDGEKEKLDVGRAIARAKFEGFPHDFIGEQAARYWASVEVPYKPFYAFEETLATFGDDPNSPSTMLAAYERITDALTRGEIVGMPPMPEKLRMRYCDAYVRRQPITSAEVFLSYAPEDQMWAEWIEAVLTRAGFHVRAYRTVGYEDAPPDGLRPDQALQAAASVVAVMSGTYVRSPEAKALWAAVSTADTGAARKKLVPLRVDDVRIPPPFTEQPAVDLTQRNADDVTAALLRAFDRPVPLTGALPAPADEPRFPWTVPAIWNLPTRNPDFTGRGASLQRMRDTLTGSGFAVVLAQALYGLGGVGKTQVALEYAHRFKADYDLIWWVPSEQTDEVTVALTELADRLDLPVSDNVGEAAAAALEALRRYGGRWLLIFDNADNPKDLEPFLPGGIGHVIITSRNQAWTHSSRTQTGIQAGEPLEVDVFTRPESITHLMRHLPDLTAEDADNVAEALGDLPLAIEQASAWLEQTHMPASTYVEQLSEQRTLIEALEQQPADYPVPVVATWNLSLERLQGQSPAAVRLLRLCAFFSPGPISNVLLYSDEMMQVLLPYDDRLSEKLIFGRVIRDISRFALVKVDQGSSSIQMHRLVQAVIRSQMTQEDAEAACHDVHKVLVGARPRQGDTDDPDNWDRYTMIWPHLVPSRADECTEVPTRQLLIDWVRYLWKNGEFEQCLSLGRRLENTWTQKLGADHPQTLHLRFHIANVLRSMGRFAEARDLDVDVLGRQQRVLEADHPHLLMTAGGLAADLRALGEFDQALERDQETYDRFRDQFGADHPRTLAAANNLAVSFRLVGDCFKAHELDEDTLTRRESVLGPDHPYTLFSSANLARDLREEGNFRESVDMLRNTYARYRAVMGDDLLDTLRTAKSLAVSLRKAGAQDEAKDLTLDTYDRYQRRYDEESPDALACALNLACDYSALDDKPRACELVSQVRDAYQASLGEDHPFTLVAANNLVTYLRGTEALIEARQLGDQTLERMRAKLGDTHPFTLSCAVNVANTMGDMEDLAQAEALERDTLGKLRERLGERHPDTLVCEANLAATLHLAGRDDEAEEIRARVLGLLSRVVGPGHPNIAMLQAWQRINRDLEPQPI
jgi:TIR domain-containing protein/tetratricopeptide repeat protein/AAA domain-containing protein